MVPNTGTIFKRERSNLQSTDPDDEDHSEEEDVFDKAKVSKVLFGIKTAS